MRPRLIILASTFAILVFSLLMGFSLLSARNSLKEGVTELRLAQADINSITARKNPANLLDNIHLRVTRAHRDFHSAADRLSPFSPLLDHLGWVPGIGDSLAAAYNVARTAEQTTGGALHLIGGLRPLAVSYGADRHGRHPSVEFFLTRLEAGQSQFRQSSSVFAQAQQSRDKIPGGHHEAALSSALHSLDRQLPRLRTLSRALTALPDLLGAHAPQTYLVAYQNSAELRATGGFVGSAGLVTVSRGRTSQRFRGTGFRDNISVPAPEPIQIYNGERGWLFRDSNWSPDFPTTAGLERFFLKLDLHQSVEGVVNVTPLAAADLLKATGPIYLPEYHRLVNGQNVAALADYYAHWKTPRTPVTDTSRKQFIGIVAQHILQGVNHLTSSKWINLIENVASAVEHRDILLNFRSRDAENLLEASSATGAINPTTSDFLYVVDTNLSYNKINPYVHLSTSYSAHVQSDGWLHSRLTLHLKNDAPSFLLSQGFGPGGGALGSPIDYATFLRIYVPSGAQLVDQRGWTEPWYPGAAYGKTMFCGYLIVPDTKSRTVTLNYVVPPNQLTWSDGKAYRLLVQHQPGSHPDVLRVTVSHNGKASTWTVLHPTLDWTRSASISTSSLHPIPLPKPAVPSVQPGHLIEPHAFLGQPNPNGPFAP